jgi:hypothetical protein
MLDGAQLQGRIIAPTIDLAQTPAEEMEKKGASHFNLNSIGQKL